MKKTIMIIALVIIAIVIQHVLYFLQTKHSLTELLKRQSQSASEQFEAYLNALPSADELQDSLALDRLLASVVSAQNDLLEIAAFDADHAIPERIFGHYSFGTKQDADLMRKAKSSNQAIFGIQTVQGQRIMKMFAPITLSLSSVDGSFPPSSLKVLIAVTSNYRFVQQALNKLLVTMILTSGTISAALIDIVLIVRLISRARARDIKTTQENYIDNMKQLYASVRGQQHDLLNHMNAIHALVALEKYEDLDNYTKELIGDISFTSDILIIGQPAMSAIIHAKSLVAKQKQIQFTFDFEGLSGYPIGVRSVDITRIMGNLIDNSFDAVIGMEEGLRQVNIRGWIEGNKLYLTISNPGSITPEEAKSIFKPWYSLKKEHTGLGLSIVKQLVGKYKGSIHLNLEQPGQVRFDVMLALFKGR
ncbi:sensor histidine kinase [Cohnella fermenti]|nr:GHKL domain-containing protein [Cohnella fermenti]